MTNQKNKTIDVQDLPTTERLTAARQMANGETAKFNGFTVVDNKRAKVKAEALANAPATYRLTQERLAAKPAPKNEPVQAGPGGYLEYDEDGKILGYVSY